MEHKPVCIIIGASHGGVTCAFALRREGWSGEIHLYDGDADLPYHRPPLSKAYLGEGVESQLLKPAESYAEENITLHLGRWVERIDPAKRVIILADGEERTYDKLVLATGGTPLIPELSGLRGARNVFTLRTAQNARNIRNANGKRVVVIGGGYIGLEVAASLRKQGAEVTILEREKRVLSRVTAPIMSHFFRELHEDHGVNIVIGATVGGIAWERTEQHVVTMGGAWYPADLIVVGVGIRPNVSLAANAGL
ncbi:MAG: FAD/NAD(P)-binding oxidoreductase, partial [Bacteroidota bacterium]